MKGTLDATTVKVLSLFVCLVACLTGCASVQQQQGKRQSGAFPENGKTSVATVGQVMVSKYDFLSLGYATLVDGIDGSFWAGRKSLAAGDKLVPAVASGQSVFCDQTPREGAACVSDEDHDGRFDHAMTMNAFGFLVSSRSISPAAYRVSDEAIKDGFKYELLYEGVNNGVVRIAYREFTENIARPAFFQDLTYTLDVSGVKTPIRFRNVAAEILRANNNEIEYVVSSNF